MEIKVTTRIILTKQSISLLSPTIQCVTFRLDKNDNERKNFGCVPHQYKL